MCQNRILMVCFCIEKLGEVLYDGFHGMLGGLKSVVESIKSLINVC